RIVERQDNDGCADADALGPRGDPAGDDHEVRGDAVPLKVVLGQPDRVEAQLLRLLDLLQLGAEDVLVAPAGRLLKEVERAEFHRGVRCQVMGVSWRSWWRQYSGEP